MAKLRRVNGFDYEDIVLVPSKGIVNSRSEVNVKQKLGIMEFELPVIPANMSTVIDEDLAINLGKKNYFYILHRFNVNTIDFIDRCKQENVFSSISLGIKENDYKLIKDLKNGGKTPDYITIDVAHGYTENVATMVKEVKENFPNVFVIAGNVATPEGALFLEEAGADALKVGIGGGSACLSTPNTGFGSRNWQLSAVEQVANKLKRAQLIADGGIKEFGDIAKSLAFGADFVMMGNLLAGHDESPGKLVSNHNGESVKEFFGSASEFQKGHNKNVEGKKLYLTPKGSIFNTLEIIKDNLQSSVSYAGGTDLSILPQVEYVFVN